MTQLLKDWRVRGVVIAAVVVGFLIGLVIFGAPWHLPPAWGDIPTWLLAVGASAAAWIALLQLNDLRRQISEDAERNRKRDQLLDKQIAEAERRERSERRRLVQSVEVRFNGRTGRVVNTSGRPINDITTKVMSKVDRNSLATPEACGELFDDGHAWRHGDDAKAVSRYEVLRPGAICGFTFDGLPGTPDEVLVAWFTDDDGFRWQLDQYQHLIESDDESEYLPIRTLQPLSPSEPAVMEGAAESAPARPAAAALQPPAPTLHAPDPAGSSGASTTVVRRPAERSPDL